MTPREGLLVQGRCHLSRILRMHCSSLLRGVDPTNLICCYDDQERVYKKNGAGVLVLLFDHLNHILKMLYFFKKISFSIPIQGIDQTNDNIVMRGSQKLTKQAIQELTGTYFLSCVSVEVFAGGR